MPVINGVTLNVMVSAPRSMKLWLITHLMMTVIGFVSTVPSDSIKKHLAFTLIDNSDLNKINNSNSMSFCEFLPSLDRILESNKYIEDFQLRNHCDFDNNIPSY